VDNNELPPVGSRLIAEPGFARLLAWAKGVAEGLGRTELCLESFALGAHLAHKNGDLRDAPTLDAHLAAHYRHFGAYLRARGASLDTVQPSSAAFHGTRDFDLAAAKVELEDDDPLLDFLNKALTGIVAGEKLERIAIHEAGHAVISLALRPEIRIKHASIRPSGERGGVVQFDADSPLYSGAHAHCLEDVKEDLCVSLAGQVATVKAYGADAANVGAGGDMQNATVTAFEAVALLGLDPEFGPIHLPTIAEMMDGVLNKQARAAHAAEAPGHSQAGGYLFDEAQRRTQALLKSAYEWTRQLVDEHWDAIERVAQLLLENEVVDEEAIRSAVRG